MWLRRVCGHKRSERFGAAKKAATKGDGLSLANDSVSASG